MGTSNSSLRPPPPAPRYGWAAFNNVYNYTLLAGGAVASALTLNPAPLILALGVEGLWMSVGTALPPFRKLVERRHQAQVDAWEAAKLEERLSQLPLEVVKGYQRAGALCDEIRAGAQGTLKASLMAEELARLDPLLTNYLDLAEQVEALAAYLGRVDRPGLERSAEQQRKALSALKGEALTLARKNLEVMEHRMARLTALEERIGVGRAQMKLLINTLQLLRDELAAPDHAMPSHSSLSEVLAGVMSARETLAEMAPPAESAEP